MNMVMVCMTMYVVCYERVCCECVVMNVIGCECDLL